MAQRHLLVSVPREPLWRGLNMARGAYLKELGNTPGHLNHWSKRSFVRLLSRYGTVVEARSPFPWTMLLVRSASAAGGSYGRGARILSVGIATTGLFTFAYFSVASHVLGDDEYGAISPLWSILFVTISVIYRPVEQLLSRTIADRRARGMDGGHPLRGPATIQAAFAAAFVVAAFARQGPDHRPARRRRRAVLGAADARRSPTRRRTSPAATSPATSGSGSTAGSCCSRRSRGSASRSRRPSGSRRARPSSRSGIVAAPFASLLVVPWALSRHAGGESLGERGARARGRRTSPRRWPRSSSPSRRCSTPRCCWCRPAGRRGSSSARS